MFESVDVLSNVSSDFFDGLVVLDFEQFDLLINHLQSINNYLYTINVYLAGFFVIVLILILIKAFNGFMNIFL